MSHRHHRICVVAAIGLGAWLVVAGGSGRTFAGPGLALVLCPLVMGLVMWLLVRPNATSSTDVSSGQHTADDGDRATSSGAGPMPIARRHRSRDRSDVSHG